MIWRWRRQWRRSAFFFFLPPAALLVLPVFHLSALFPARSSFPFPILTWTNPLKRFLVLSLFHSYSFHHSLPGFIFSFFGHCTIRELYNRMRTAFSLFSCFFWLGNDPILFLESTHMTKHGWKRIWSDEVPRSLSRFRNVLFPIFSISHFCLIFSDKKDTDKTYVYFYYSHVK